jgi:NAD(P)-dependent dehydrogenase (short-subunit alcohol dehydrogenase family)
MVKEDIEMTTATQRFTGTAAVVAGGASGIGLAIVRRLHAEGAQVVAGDIAVDRLKEIAAELGDRFAWTKTDVTQEADAEALVALATDRFGGIDAAFNVAGASRPGYIVDLPESDWDFTVDLCLKGVFLGMKHQARQMMRQGGRDTSPGGIAPGGRGGSVAGSRGGSVAGSRGGSVAGSRGGSIVNIASLNAHVPMHGGSAYVAAKAGVDMLSKNGALEFAAHGIRVNAILPGLVQTPLTRRHFDNPDAHAAYMQRIPMGRAAQPEEIAGPALFLCSPDASYISGASLLVDGAWEVSGYPDMRPFRGPATWNAR